jgi:hypothetical protein
VLEARSGKSYHDESSIRAFRIILDHMRAASFMLAEGVTPSNTEAGYVLRRLIRRTIREVDRLGIKDSVLADIAEGYGEVYADAYPHVKAAAAKIREELTKEEDQFRKTLTNGLKEFEKLAAKHEVSAEDAALIKQTKATAGRLVAVGTTVTRTLETLARRPEGYTAVSDQSALYIRPGHHFRAVDGLLTNFHLPRSTPLLLASAFAGRDQLLSAYREAVALQYRLFSFGDAMLIL